MFVYNDTVNAIVNDHVSYNDTGNDATMINCVVNVGNAQSRLLRVL
jgi:hypothetical protein